MTEADRFEYEVSKDQSAETLEELATQLLQKSQTDIEEILRNYKVTEKDAKEIATQATQSKIEVKYEHAGSTPELVAIAVTLVPVIKVLTPLLQPFATKGADFTFRVANDIWEMVKNKLFHDHSVRLRSKEKPKRK
jgi:hypothetical protein